MSLTDCWTSHWVDQASHFLQVLGSLAERISLSPFGSSGTTVTTAQPEATASFFSFDFLAGLASPEWSLPEWHQRSSPPRIWNDEMPLKKGEHIPEITTLWINETGPPKPNQRSGSAATCCKLRSIHPAESIGHPTCCHRWASVWTHWFWPC